MQARRLSVLALLFFATACSSRAKAPPKGGFAYPEARAGDHIDSYGDARVADPYRWMEQPDSPELKAWIEAQNKLTYGWLQKGRDRRRIRERLEELWNYERYSVPTVEGGRYVYRHNSGLQNQSVLEQAESLDGQSTGSSPRVLLDPNTLSEDGTIALAGTWFSPNGRLLAYATSSGGSDWREVRVRDLETGDDMAADHLRWIKWGGVAWNAEGSGFYYTRYPRPEAGRELTASNTAPRVFYHSVGTAQDEDVLVYERPDNPDWSLFPWTSEDGKFLVIHASPSSSKFNVLFVLDLTTGGAFKRIIEGFDARYRTLGNVGSTLLLSTDSGAARGRVIAVDIDDPAPEKWSDIVPEGRDTIRRASLVGDRIFVNRLHLARSQVTVYTLDGKIDKRIALPGVGTARGFKGRSHDTETFFSFSSYIHPTTIYRYDIATGETSLFRKPKVDFDPSEFVTRQVTYRGKTGGKISMFISHRRGLLLDNSHPTLLAGYGGFNISLTPRFSVASLVWMEMGGVYAVANIRGGGEYGEKWHRAGMLKNKQNCFDDFAAAAEGLIANGYTAPSHLAIMGGSNGGLLVGACVNQRPGLFAAALPAVGVMDMLRFQHFTAGRFWVAEYGSADDPEMFPVLRAYSPYHNIVPGVRYPAVLVTTADHDDRVVPMHSFKYAARLQAAQAGANPILIRIDTRAGHGAGTPTQKRIDLAADKWTFLVRALRMKIDFD